jgi:hypothetical protein
MAAGKAIGQIGSIGSRRQNPTTVQERIEEKEAAEKAAGDKRNNAGAAWRCIGCHGDTHVSTAAAAAISSTASASVPSIGRSTATTSAASDTSATSDVSRREQAITRAATLAV